MGWYVGLVVRVINCLEVRRRGLLCILDAQVPLLGLGHGGLGDLYWRTGLSERTVMAKCLVDYLARGIADLGSNFTPNGSLV